MNWTYDQSDPALMLFTAAKARFGFDCAPDAKLLELGCAETDFLERLKKQNPAMELTGVDARRDRDPDGWTQIIGNAFGDSERFAPHSFDAIVMLGALEHFGLGFYGDPVYQMGDVKTLFCVDRWLKPGGWVYFDVPCNPTSRITENKHFRIYSPRDVGGLFMFARGLREKARAYSDCEPRAGQWCDEPTIEKVPYHFCAVLAEKVSS